MSNLPTGYTKLKYLQSSGTQWIDTGIKPYSGMVVEYEASKLDNLGNCTDFGVYSGANVYIGLVSTKWRVGSGNGYITSQIVADSNRHKFKYSISDTLSLELDDVVIASGTFMSSIYETNQNTMWIFAANNNGAIHRSVAMKIYNFKIGNHEFIPALRNSDSKPGMYDTITGEFLVNQGTGEFTYEIESTEYAAYKTVILFDELPARYKRVEYLKSTGEQYLNLGFIPDAEITKFECKILWVQNSKSSIYGSTNSPRFDLGNNSNSQYSIGIAGQLVMPTGFSIELNKEYNYSVIISSNGLVATLYEGENLIGSATGVNTSYNSELYMFARNTNSTANNFFKGNIYNLTFYKGDNKYHNYVPCIDTENNNKPGMYDTVTNTFLINQDSGADFIAGPEITEEYNSYKTIIVDEEGNEYISYKTMIVD